MKKIFSLFMLMLLMAGFSAKAENEIYAVLDPYVHCLTLYYDDQRESRGGMTSWSNIEIKRQVTLLDFDLSMKNARPTKTDGWFGSYSYLTEIRHLEYLNTSQVTDMAAMFMGCYALTTVDIRSFDISNVTSMSYMFFECTNLTTIYCKGNWSTTSANTSNMFNGCTSLVGGNGTTYDANHTDASYARLDQPGQQGYFTDKGPEIYALYDASTTTMTLYYDNMCIENGGSTAWWNDFIPFQNDITTAVLDESMQSAHPTSTRNWFNGCTHLTEIQNLDYLNTSEVTDMSQMFYYCYALTSVDLRSFDVTNVTDMACMFEECRALKTIYCGGNWSTTTANSNRMFRACFALVGGNGTTFDSDHTDASYARLDEPGTPGYFALEEYIPEEIIPEEIVPVYALYDDISGTMTLYCDNRQEEKGGIPQERWNELPYDEVITVVLDESMKNARPRSTSGWFYYFTRLRDIQHLDYLNTSEVTDMSIMFRNCERLTTLDLRSFDITKVTNMRLMFMDCAALKTIYCNDDWSTTTADSESMFKGCTSIVGGNGTTYDANHEDASYARYDEPGAPGYFTKKTATGIDQTTNDERLTTNKLLRDGQLLILRDGKLFDVTGAEVR